MLGEVPWVPEHLPAAVPTPTRDDYAAARWIAFSAHEGQVDKDGHPHMLHVVRVTKAVPFSCKPAALLHDVVEDTAVTLGNLGFFGVSQKTIHAVDVLTRRGSGFGGEKYSHYIERVINSGSTAADIARIVKVADLKDNLIRSLAGGHKSLIHRYEKALSRMGQSWWVTNTLTNS